MDKFLKEAIKEAYTGLLEGGIPIGAILVYEGEIIGRGHNRRIQKQSAILHAEMDALENAGRQQPNIYHKSVLYTTLSPCAMCAGAILLYGIPRVVIGENKTFTGEEDLLKSRGVEVEVVKNLECFHLLQSYINNNGGIWYEDIGMPEMNASGTDFRGDSLLRTNNFNYTA